LIPIRGDKFVVGDCECIHPELQSLSLEPIVQLLNFFCFPMTSKVDLHLISFCLLCIRFFLIGYFLCVCERENIVEKRITS
jgi:hypothetical protein